MTLFPEARTGQYVVAAAVERQRILMVIEQRTPILTRSGCPRLITWRSLGGRVYYASESMSDGLLPYSVSVDPTGSKSSICSF